jgi:hypothetical protein
LKGDHLFAHNKNRRSASPPMVMADIETQFLLAQQRRYRAYCD